jgi:PAS domain-containing protein
MNSTDFPMIVRGIEAGDLVWVNRSLTNEFGWIAAELLKKPLLDWIDEAARPAFSSVLAAGQGEIRADHLAKNDSTVSIDWEVRTEGDRVFVLGLLAGQSQRPVAQQREPGATGDDPLSETLRSMALILEDQWR